MKRYIYLIRRYPSNLIQKLLLRYKVFRVEESVLIFGEMRGGSTWLMELLSNIPNTCINWEPFHKTRGILGNYEGTKPFVGKEEDEEKYYDLIKKTLEYKINTNWTMVFLTIPKLWKSKIVITKFIRANLLLPFILDSFKFKYRPIFLIRHPIDTCYSQLKGNNAIPELNITSYTESEFSTDELHFISGLKSPLEIQIANWLMNNLKTLERIRNRPNDIQIVFYSDLLMNPRKEFEKTVEILGTCTREERNRIVENIDYKKASKSDFKNAFKKNPEEQLYKTLNVLDEETKDDIQSIFNYFDFKLYNTYSPFPDKKYLFEGQD